MFAFCILRFLIKMSSQLFLTQGIRLTHKQQRLDLVRWLVEEKKTQRLNQIFLFLLKYSLQADFDDSEFFRLNVFKLIFLLKFDVDF